MLYQVLGYTMNTMRCAVLLMIALLMTGCSSGPPASTPQTFENAGTQANHDKQISLEGYPRLPSTVYVKDHVSVELHEKADGKGKYLRFTVPVGSGKNQCEKPPKDFKQEDLKLHAADGTVVGINDKIRVSGKLFWTKDHAWMDTPLYIEKL